MAISFRDREIISITDFSCEEILHRCEARRRRYEVEPADLAAYVASLPGAIGPAR